MFWKIQCLSLANLANFPFSFPCFIHVILSLLSRQYLYCLDKLYCLYCLDVYFIKINWKYVAALNSRIPILVTKLHKKIQEHHAYYINYSLKLYNFWRKRF